MHAIIILAPIYHWLEVHTGTVNEPGPYYGFWSGFGSFVPLLIPAAAFYWHHTCHVGRCARFGKHAVPGTGYKTCKRHHPTIDGPVTAADISEAHRVAQGPGTTEHAE